MFPNKTPCCGTSSRLTPYWVIRIASVILICGSWGRQVVWADDWPCFLGPQHNGVSSEKKLAGKWAAEGPPVLWKVEIGTGYSAPSVRGNRLVIHHRPPRTDDSIIDCLDRKTGEKLWSFRYTSTFSDPFGYNNGPRCSPLLTEKYCITYGAEGDLICLLLENGKKVWERRTQSEFQVPDHFFGAGCSPLLEGNLVIVHVGGQPNSAVVAFDVATGKTVWQSVGKLTWNGAPTDEPKKTYKWTGTEMMVSYAPPVAATIHNQRHLLCLVRQGLVSLDPANGKMRFQYWFRSTKHESVNAATPVVIGDQILLTAAYDTGSALLKVRPDNKSFDVVWRKPKGLSAHWSTPIVHNGYAYGFSGRHEPEATFQAIDLKNGTLAWETSGVLFPLDELEFDAVSKSFRKKGTEVAIPHPFLGRGSLIMADDKFITLGERGTLTLVKPSPQEYVELSRTTYPELQYPTWTAPVLSDGLLYLRSETHLLCLNIADTATR